MGEVPVEAPSSRAISFELETAQEEESDIVGDDISEDSYEEQEEEWDICNATETRNQTSAKHTVM